VGSLPQARGCSAALGLPYAREKRGVADAIVSDDACPEPVEGFEGKIMGIVLGLSNRRHIETDAAEEVKDDRHT
jgi:hypothetical protein